MTTPRFSLLVPVKDGRHAKTRLGDLAPQLRARLMTAFAWDAIAAARRTPLVEVYVVTDARSFGDGLDVPVLPDEGDGDLNRALRRAATRVARPGRGVAVMLADLPSLRTEDLEIALDGDGRRFVADAAGTGTTLLLARPGDDLDPRFGAGSAQAHRDSGAEPVSGDLMSLRLDVDTTADLGRALKLGLGPHTARVIDELGDVAAEPSIDR